ncbi:TetR/AcrR family transcriptional regulator [Galactobacter valiniphilus]|uniref:TetR/AcrR family transcriptional regulator n=1 Tax=Galactobacter valiniphilus TaxID=2676122 RepID=UPI003734F930
MPKISAPSVAEHHAAQVRALLDATRELLRESGKAPSMADVAARAGLARSSVYQYFSSRQALLEGLVKDIFPRWAERITSAMAAAPTPADAVLAYARSNLDLVADGEHAVGAALATLAPGEAIGAEAHSMHQQISEPLAEALKTLGVGAPEVVAELINAVVHAATRRLEAGASREQAQASVAELLGPFVREHGGA